MPFHLDYRPTSFSQFIGNENLKEALQAVLADPNGSRVLLFAGPKGCGKTTLAYIVKNELKCDDFDFHHLNLGNTRGIDSAREIESNMNLKPIGGPIKIYLLNECQNATSDFWECMLDPLEVPPKHVFFILCTTDPDKLKGTVLSRCTRFDVKPLRAQELRGLLDHVLKVEGVKQFPKEALNKISLICENSSPREALILLNKVIDIEDDKVIMEILEQEALSKDFEIKELFRVLLDKAPWADVITVLNKLQDQNPESLRHAVLTYCNKKLLSKDSRQAAVLIECFSEPFYNTKHAGFTLACYRGVMDNA